MTAAVLKLSDKTLTTHVTGLRTPDGVWLNVVLEDARGGLSGYWVRVDATPQSDGLLFRTDDAAGRESRVRLLGGEPMACSCGDFKYRRRTCKHMVAAPTVVAETF